MSGVGVQPTIPVRDEWTFEDVDALDVTDWWRYEVVDGALVVSPSTGGDHELASAEIRAVLRDSFRPVTCSAGRWACRSTAPMSLTAYELRGADVYTELGSWRAGETARLATPFEIEIEIDRLA